MPIDDTPIHPMCVKHEATIVGIAATLEGVDGKVDMLVERVGIQNGRVAKSEEIISALAVKQSAHDVIQTTIMQKLIPLEESMGKMKDWRAGMRGSAETTAKIMRDWGVLIGLALALWQGYIQREALKAQIDQVQHAQAAAQQTRQ